MGALEKCKPMVIFVLDCNGSFWRKGRIYVRVYHISISTCLKGPACLTIQKSQVSLYICIHLLTPTHWNITARVQVQMIVNNNRLVLFCAFQRFEYQAKLYWQAQPSSSRIWTIRCILKDMEDIGHRSSIQILNYILNIKLIPIAKTNLDADYLAIHLVFWPSVW